MMSGLTIAIAIICLLLPRYFTLVITIAFFPLFFGGWIPAALSLGEFDFNYLDLLVLGLTVKQVILLIFGKAVFPSTQLTVPIGIFLASYLLSVLYQFLIGSNFAFLEFVSLSRFYLLFCLVFSMQTMQLDASKTRFIRSTMIVSGFIYAASIIVQYILKKIGFSFGYFLIYKNDAGRFSGLIGDPNQASIFVAFIAFYFILMNVMTRKIKYLAGFLIALTAIFLTGTRGGIFMFAAGLTAIFLLERYKARFLSLLVLALPVIIAIVLAVPTITVVLDRSKGNTLTTGVTGRIQPILRSAKIVLDHPLLGVGFSGHRFVAHNYESSETKGNMNGSYNQYAETAINGGLVSLACYIFMVIALLRNIRSGSNLFSLEPDERTFFKATYYYLLSVLVFLQTDVWLLPASSSGYLLFILIAVTAAIQSRQPVEQQIWAAEPPQTSADIAFGISK